MWPSAAAGAVLVVVVVGSVWLYGSFLGSNARVASDGHFWAHQSLKRPRHSHFHVPRLGRASPRLRELTGTSSFLGAAPGPSGHSGQRWRVPWGRQSEKPGTTTQPFLLLVGRSRLLGFATPVSLKGMEGSGGGDFSHFLKGAQGEVGLSCWKFWVWPGPSANLPFLSPLFRLLGHPGRG